MMSVNADSTLTGCEKSVLVVEDDDGIRDTLRYVLEFEGYRVFTAANGREGLDILDKTPASPCLILLDLMMPVMDGWQFAEMLEHDRNHSETPVVVVTAFSDQVKAIKAKAMIRKPVDLDTLLQTVRKWCGQAH